MTHQWDENPYADMVDNGPMVQAYATNAARLGRTVLDPVTSGRRVVGSTDMGNISYLVPSIHPMIKVAPDGVPIHSVDFAKWAGSAEGDLAVLDGAKAMAMTVIDLWCSPGVLDQTQAAFATRPQGIAVL